MTILQETLYKMPATFSSNQFAEKAKDLGYPEHFIKSGKIGHFLHNNCKQSPESRRLWYKTAKDLSVNQDDELQRAIAIVKANGYKIMKQVSDWKEI